MIRNNMFVITNTSKPAMENKPQSVEGSDRPTAKLSNRMTSRELFGSAKSVQITHGDQTYRLQITRLGKLILTK